MSAKISTEGMCIDRLKMGVLPIYERVPDVMPRPYDRVEDVPKDLMRLIEHVNGRNKMYACEAARKAAPEKKE